MFLWELFSTKFLTNKPQNEESVASNPQTGCLFYTQQTNLFDTEVTDEQDGRVVGFDIVSKPLIDTTSVRSTISAVHFSPGTVAAYVPRTRLPQQTQSTGLISLLLRDISPSIDSKTEDILEIAEQPVREPQSAFATFTKLENISCTQMIESAPALLIHSKLLTPISFVSRDMIIVGLPVENNTHSGCITDGNFLKTIERR